MLLPPLSQKVRALADCDSFFASCEIARNPSLKGQPVCVGGDICIAATYEAKALGVRGIMPMREVKKILGDRAIYIRPDMHYYGSVSRKVMQCLREFSADVLVSSVDEAYFDITHYGQLDSRAYELIAQQIQQRIYEHVGVPISIGVGPTRLLAKLFAKINKPKGVYAALTQEEIWGTIKDMTLTDMPYIAVRSANRMYMCPTIGDFYQLDGRTIKQRMGRGGLKLWLEIHGINTLSRRQHRKHPKSISRSRSFNPDFTDDKTLLWDKMIGQFEKVYSSLLTKNLKARHFGVWFRTKQFERHSSKRKLPMYCNDKAILLKNLREMFLEAYQPHTLYRTTGLVLGDLVYQHFEPINLFVDNTKELQQKKLNETIQALNQKYGKIAVATASTQQSLYQKKPAVLAGLIGEISG